MLHAFRKARAAQFVLLVAGFLAVSGSFGLHPEPEGPAARVAAGDGWNALNRSGTAAKHDCYLCLLHKSVSLPRLAAVVLEVGSAVTVRPVTDSSPLGRLESHPREGRAPPAWI
jgi:hypothetical protein